MATAGEFPIKTAGKWVVRPDGCWSVPATTSAPSFSPPCCCVGCTGPSNVFGESEDTFKETVQVVISGVTLACCVPFNGFFFSVVSGDPNGTYCLPRIRPSVQNSGVCIWGVQLATPIVVEGRATAGCTGTLRQTNTYTWLFVSAITEALPGVGPGNVPRLAIFFVQGNPFGGGNVESSERQQGIGPFHAHVNQTPNCTNGTYSNISTVCATPVTQPESGTPNAYYGVGVGGTAVVDFGGC